MDLDDIQRKFPRISNGDDGRLDSAKVVYGKKMDGQYNGDEEDGKSKRGGGGSNGGGSVGGVDLGGGAGGFYGWASSRIVRVSRASGGKDRHSKVLTSKGLRDRRVRLSVNTAIQFYDLQDRLGYDQPSKAVEWLLKAAASSISELPPMNSPFPDTPKQLSDEKRCSNGGSDQLRLDSVEVEMHHGGGDGGDTKYYIHQQMTKPSACSSTSETSKSSGLSLSRSESRIKARERAKVRVAGKEKEKGNESSQIPSLNPFSHTTSFTELLSAGMNSNKPTSPNRSIQENSNGGVNVNESNFFQKSRLWSSTPTEYFSTGPGQIHFANSLTSMASPMFSVAGENQTEIQHFSFVPEHFVPASNSNSNQNNGSNEYNLNFTISSPANTSGLAAYNGGTLQSNSTPPPSMLPYNYLQRFSLIDGSSSPSIFLGTAAPVENHHQFLPGFDARLQLRYGDPNPNNGAGRHSSQKGKGKN